MKRPVVGISTYLEQARWGNWNQQAALLPQSYVDSVVKAGGIPVLLPPAIGRAAEAIGAVDALVLSGGPDVDPTLYGEPPHQRTSSRPDRDEWELTLLRAALVKRRPVLAICRGMQLLNVAFGGTLHQHLPEIVGNEEHLPRPGVFGINQVRVTPASRLAGVLGRRSTVSCHHHQAVHVLGDGLGPAAWAVDETIEAIEHFQHDFVIGVQWHPEERPKDVRLFRALVQAAAHRLGPGTPAIGAASTPAIEAPAAQPAQTTQSARKKSARAGAAIQVRRPAKKKDPQQ